MKKLIGAVIILGLIILGIAFNSGEPAPQLAKAGSKIGTYFTPRNFPDSFVKLQQNHIDEYFSMNGKIGGHVASIHRWDEPQLDGLTKKVLKQSKERGFKFFLHADPLTFMTRKSAAPPKEVGTSFADIKVREAFKAKMLEYASWKPDILGMGIEVNLLLFENNKKEFDSFASLAKEAYEAVKTKYPEQTVTISFSWDIMRQESQYDILAQFKDSVDIYSFTTYPNVLTVPDQKMPPADFFSAIRKYLPTERIAISELSWFSGAYGSEAGQKSFFERLPQLLKSVNPEYVTITYLFDMPESFVADPKFNSMGLVRADGTAKPSWETVLGWEAVP